MTEKQLVEQLEEVKAQIFNKDMWKQESIDYRRKRIEICKELVALHPKKYKKELEDAEGDYYRDPDWDEIIKKWNEEHNK